MNIGTVIRTYRKEAGLTQEEVANRLGVTAPAVNKWENGNSNPDIELLAPLARLLHTSPDTLLSFREELTSAEIGAIIRELDTKLDEEGFEQAYQWALEKIREYPNCNMLIWQVAVLLDARRLTGGCPGSERYEAQINAWYELALGDEKEEIKRHAADSLFGFYLRKKEFAKAEEYLQYFSDFDPVKKNYEGRLYKEKGEIENAYERFEHVIYAEYQTLNFALSLMAVTALEEGDVPKARYFAEKTGALAGIFEMGRYHECAPMLDVVCAEKNAVETCHVVGELLENVDSLCDFTKSKLYQHMKLNEPEGSYAGELKERLLEGFRDEETFGYMKGNADWEKLLAEA